MQNDDGRALAEPSSREPSPAVSALTGFDPSRAYISDARGLFCGNCGRAHWRHPYRAGTGFLCAMGGGE